MSWSIYVFCRLPLLLFPFVGIQNSKLCPSSSSCLHMCPENFLFDLAVLFKVWTLKVEMNIVRLLFNTGIFCLVFANFSSAAIPGTTGWDLFISMTVNAAWVLRNIIRHNFLPVSDLRVDGRNTYQQSQCSAQNNSNSQPEYARLYLPVSTTLVLLPANRSSICLDPNLWPAWLGKTCQKLKLPPV